LDVVAHAPIEKIELYDGTRQIECMRPYSESDLGARYRVSCKGQETRGRQRLVKWTATADLSGATISRIKATNFYNPDRQPVLASPTCVEWTSVTTGGAQSIDLWIENETADSAIDVKTNQGNMKIALADVSIDGTEIACGGIDKALIIQRLPEQLTETQLSLSREVTIPVKGDSVIYARITLEDGHVAWTSPIYSFK
jgi:hypothetical protein